MNASPAMETGGPLVCLGATATLRSTAGTRSVAVEELFAGPGTHRRPQPGELLVAIDVPDPAAGTGSCYVRLEYRRQMEIAVVGATAVVTLDGRRRRGRADRDHGARADDPSRARGRGRRSSAPTAAPTPIAAAARAAAEAATPISDVRASERLPPGDGRR